MRVSVFFACEEVENCRNAGQDPAELIANYNPVNVRKWRKAVDSLSKVKRVNKRKATSHSKTSEMPDMKEFRNLLMQAAKTNSAQGQHQSTRSLQRVGKRIKLQMETEQPERKFVPAGSCVPFKVSKTWVRRFVKTNLEYRFVKPRNKRCLRPEEQPAIMEKYLDKLRCACIAEDNKFFSHEDHSHYTGDWGFFAPSWRYLLRIKSGEGALQ